ncbi:MAG TPA: bifunctional folylpolyglutamate synthase/dihydrofolate synthase [Clostridiales bacterium]|nr:bifunctional folylpolyglutamate synthase/dihydrofolate synthase [Clostridiales bacterium]
MNYKEALDFILGAETMGSILERNVIECLLEELGNPHKGLKYVHIAGTNGKGSTSAYVSSILRAAGYRTGLYTSPYIQQFNERIQVDGVQISDEELAEITTEIAEATKRVLARGLRHPTVFELITALGFIYFKRRACDIVVLEVGLGGRLDATNVIESPEVAVITNIGYDHMDVLGDTLELIAGEKAGIIKSNCRVVLYSQAKGVEEVIASVCGEKGASLTYADTSLAKVRSVSLDGIEFDYNGYLGLKSSLLGLYQVKNAVTAIVTAEELIKKGYAISEQNIRDGLAGAHWPGRLELLRRNPAVIVDGAHNPQGAAALLESLDALFPGRKINFIVGVLADKDYSSTIELTMPHAKCFYTVTPPNKRALSADKLALEIKKHGDAPVYFYGSIPSAIDAVLSSVTADDVICIFGSLYQVGEVRSYFGRDKF